MWVGHPKAFFYSDGFHQFSCPFLHLLSAHGSKKLHGLFDNVGDSLSWIQGRIRILEDHLHIIAELFHLPALQPGHILPLEDDLSLRAFIQVDQRSAKGGFSAPGFAYQAEGLSFFNLQCNVVDCVNHAGMAFKILFQVLSFQQNRHRSHPLLYSPAAREMTGRQFDHLVIVSVALMAFMRTSLLKITAFSQL